MQTIKLQTNDQIIKIAELTKVFNEVEISILKEILDNNKKDPDKDYFLRTINKDSTICGFIIFGRSPLTKNTWDLYWLAVSPLFYKQGIAKQLIENFEKELIEISEIPAVVRIETSSRNEYTAARNLYLRCGYNQVGFIEDFYDTGDSLHTYSKIIQPVKR